MKSYTYQALVVEEQDGKYIASIREKETSDLPEHNTLVRVYYSSLNYKDALSVIGNKGVTKNYPHTPGIDAAGKIVFSSDKRFREGDEVVVMGYDLGMNTSGGWGQYISVPSDWVVKLPEGISMKESMIIGTAGFTAGISLNKLTEVVRPDSGKIVVSGATGGVGSVALSLLSKLGYETIAVSRKSNETAFLRELGADEIISSDEFINQPDKPILSACYAGGIDTVGGKTLENMLKATQLYGAVTTCGSVSGTNLNISVFPFILRGISLVGISAQNYPADLRESLWQKLSKEWKPDNLLKIYTEINLSGLKSAVDDILAGKLKGRTVVNMD